MTRSNLVGVGFNFSHVEALITCEMATRGNSICRHIYHMRLVAGLDEEVTRKEEDIYSGFPVGRRYCLKTLNMVLLLVSPEGILKVGRRPTRIRALPPPHYPGKPHSGWDLSIIPPVLCHMGFVLGGILVRSYY